MSSVSFVETVTSAEDGALVEPEKAWRYDVTIDHCGRIVGDGERMPLDLATLKPIEKAKVQPVPAAVLRWLQDSGSLTVTRYELLEIEAADEVSALMGDRLDEAWDRHVEGAA